MQQDDGQDEWPVEYRNQFRTPCLDHSCTQRQSLGVTQAAPGMGRVHVPIVTAPVPTYPALCALSQHKTAPAHVDPGPTVQSLHRETQRSHDNKAAQGATPRLQLLLHTHPSPTRKTQRRPWLVHSTADVPTLCSPAPQLQHQHQFKSAAFRAALRYVHGSRPQGHRQDKTFIRPCMPVPRHRQPNSHAARALAYGSANADTVLQLATTP